MFGRATITLGIGPHSSFMCIIFIFIALYTCADVIIDIRLLLTSACLLTHVTYISLSTGADTKIP